MDTEDDPMVVVPSGSPKDILDSFDPDCSDNISRHITIISSLHYIA